MSERREAGTPPSSEASDRGTGIPARSERSHVVERGPSGPAAEPPRAGDVSEQRSERLRVGRVGRAHGLSGELAVTFSSNRSQRWAPGAVLCACDESGTDEAEGATRRLVVEASRPHGDRWLLRFEGITDRDAAEALSGAVLEAEVAPGRLPEGEHWVHELVGASVRDVSGATWGEVVALEANPASDLLVLDDATLIPVRFIVGVEEGVGDVARTVIVDPPEGLR